MNSDDATASEPYFRYKTGRTVHSIDEWASGYSVEWVTYNEGIAGWGLRRPMEYRLALLKTDDDPHHHREIASIKVPVSLARAYGRLKRRLKRDD